MKELLDQFYKDIKKYFDTKIFEHKPDNLYEPINHIMSSGGKRFRTLLTLLGYYGYDKNYKNALQLAYAVELFHNFTLVHDDIMDDAPLRRGKKTVHEMYNVNSAILSGDVMQSYVIKEISEIDSPMTLRIINRFSEIAIKVCEGQSYDMIFEKRDDVSIEEYLNMIEMKTAVLLGLSLELGALLAGANDEAASHLFHFGKNAGIAFQLQDDYLDLYGEKAKVGKQLCGDIIQRKKNYFFVKAYELLEFEDRDRFVELYQSKMEDGKRIDNVLTIYDELYLKNYLKEAKSSYLDLSYSHLNMSSYQADKAPILKKLALELADRRY